MHPLLELRQQRDIETPPGTLVGEGRVAEAVAEHGRAPSQSRLDQRHEVIAPRSEDEQRFGQRIHRVVQHVCAQLFGQRRAARLSRRHDFRPAGTEPLGKRGDVRRLACAVDALQRDEATAAQGFFLPGRWYLSTARLC